MLNRPTLASLENFVFHPALLSEQQILRSYCTIGECYEFEILYIRGGIGKGKMHLLHAIHNDLKSYHPGLNLKLIDAWKLVDKFIDALRAGRLLEFNNYYQEVDALFIDNFESCAGKEKTLWHMNFLFKTIALAGGKIILTSNELSETRPKFYFEAINTLVIDLSQNTIKPKSKSFTKPSPEEIKQIVKGMNRMFKDARPRNPARIPLLLREIERVWMQNPDLRLTKLLLNTALPSVAAPEVFYLEDDDLLNALREI